MMFTTYIYRRADQ